MHNTFILSLLTASVFALVPRVPGGLSTNLPGLEAAPADAAQISDGEGIRTSGAESAQPLPQSRSMIAARWDPPRPSQNKPNPPRPQVIKPPQVKPPPSVHPSEFRGTRTPYERGSNHARESRTWDQCRRGECGYSTNRGRDWGSIDCRKGGCNGWRNDHGHIYRDGRWYDERGYYWKNNGWYDSKGKVFPGPNPIVLEPIAVSIPVPVLGSGLLGGLFGGSAPSSADDTEKYCRGLNVRPSELPNECLDYCDDNGGRPRWCS